jgi:Flp pilus assembly pilin Flp
MFFFPLLKTKFDKLFRVEHYVAWDCGWFSVAVTGARLGGSMLEFIHKLWSDDSGQDIAEYAVMLAVILVLVVGTIRLIGTNANTVFSNVASSIQ